MSCLMRMLTFSLWAEFMILMMLGVNAVDIGGKKKHDVDALC